MKYIKINFIALVTVLITVFNLSGCGYTARSMVNPEFRNIYIEPFENAIDIFSEESQDNFFRSYFPLLERDITNKVIERFIFDGNLKVTKPEKADIILSGKVLRYQRDAVRYEDIDEDDVEEYRISLIVSLVLKRAETGKIVWEEPSFVGDSTYFVNRTSEAAAVRKAIDDLAVRVVERLVEDW